MIIEPKVEKPPQDKNTKASQDASLVLDDHDFSFIKPPTQETPLIFYNQQYHFLQESSTCGDLDSSNDSDEPVDISDVVLLGLPESDSKIALPAMSDIKAAPGARHKTPAPKKNSKKVRFATANSSTSRDTQTEMEFTNLREITEGQIVMLAEALLISLHYKVLPEYRPMKYQPYFNEQGDLVLPNPEPFEEEKAAEPTIREVSPELPQIRVATFFQRSSIWYCNSGYGTEPHPPEPVTAPPHEVMKNWDSKDWDNWLRNVCFVCHDPLHRMETCEKKKQKWFQICFGCGRWGLISANCYACNERNKKKKTGKISKK